MTDQATRLRGRATGRRGLGRHTWTATHVYKRRRQSPSILTGQLLACGRRPRLAHIFGSRIIAAEGSAEEFARGCSGQ
jgi:hypothetical protein